MRWSGFSGVRPSSPILETPPYLRRGTSAQHRTKCAHSLWRFNGTGTTLRRSGASPANATVRHLPRPRLPLQVHRNSSCAVSTPIPDSPLSFYGCATGFMDIATGSRVPAGDDNWRGSGPRFRPPRSLQESRSLPLLRPAPRHFSLPARSSPAYATVLRPHPYRSPPQARTATVCLLRTDARSYHHRRWSDGLAGSVAALGMTYGWTES